jgi:RNA polymerase sigma-70 factor (ECF subfamily)
MDRFALTISSPTAHLRFRRNPKVDDAAKQGTAETDSNGGSAVASAPRQGALSHADTDATFPSSEELLRRVGAGDRGAKELLADRFTEQVFTIASKILHNPEEAEHVTRIIFSEIFREAHLFDPIQETAEAAFRRYPYHRCYARLHWMVSRSLASRFGTPTKTEQADPPFSATARDGFSVAKLTEMMARAMRSLPDAERRVVTLMYFQGLTRAEVSEQLNLKVAEVAKLYYRGAKRILKQVQQGPKKETNEPSS